MGNVVQTRGALGLGKTRPTAIEETEAKFISSQKKACAGNELAFFESLHYHRRLS